MLFRVNLDRHRTKNVVISVLVVDRLDRLNVNSVLDLSYHELNVDKAQH